MRIIYFHQYFSTPYGSAGTRSYFFAKQLINSGHEVFMVCLSDERCNSGLKKPFKNNFRKGIVDGINIIEFNYKYSNKLNLIGRLLVFLKFSLKALNFSLISNADLIFCTSTPLSIALPGICCRWIKGTPFVFEVRDLWPELPVAMGLKINPIFLKIINIFEKLSYQSADQLIGLAPGICRGIIRKGVNAEKVNMIPNGCDLDLFYPPENYIKENLEEIDLNINESKKFIAAFTGAHGRANGLDALLDAAVELKKIGNKNIHIIFIGDGSKKLQLIERAKIENLDNCHFLDSIPKTRLAEVLRKNIDVGLMILDDIPAFQYGTSPNKFFDYLAAGLPVITNYPGWISELIEENKLGKSVKPQNPKALANALLYMSKNDFLVKEYSKNSRILGTKSFSRDTQSKNFCKLIEKAFYQNKNRRNKYLLNQIYNFFKNQVDRIIATLAFILLLPILLIIALSVLFNLGRPIFFIQKRPGYKSEPFYLIKFRSMKNKYDDKGVLLEDSSRLNNFGKWLRSTSLDELPTLVNIMRGQISFVGPRPLLMRYLPLYSYDQNRRHEVKPGLTGWAQVNGRNNISWERRLELDTWYVDNRNFSLDIFILFKTLIKVLKREGISYKGQDTMPLFKGQNK